MNNITVNETSTGRYIGVQFFLVRKDEKVIGLIAKKDDSSEWLVSRQDSPKFSRTRGFNARCVDKDSAVAKAVELHDAYQAFAKSLADAITGNGPTSLLDGKVEVIR
tara:strand:+ start:272 stop:592 length:321 start_codon:yes stop_codon:yes gene_type:complete